MRKYNKCNNIISNNLFIDKKMIEEMKKQTELLEKILLENKHANDKFEEYSKDSLRELREIKVRLIESLNKIN